MYTEQIFYWLRKTTDELISLIYILSHNKKQKQFPNKIKTSSIGELLKKPDSPIFKIFEPHINELKTLNKISNGYKHSFVNSQISAHRGLHEPLIFALNLDYNDTKRKPEFYSLKFSDLLIEYNEFLSFIKKYIKNNFELEK